MANKKPGRKPVMRTKIERYMAKHPDAPASVVAKACGCTLGYVYMVRKDAKPAPVKPVLKEEPMVPEPSFLQRLKEFALLVIKGKEVA